MLSGFGTNSTTAAAVGTPIKFTPVTGSDTMVKNGVTQNISTRHHCITCMKEYESKSLEELRLEDYIANRKGPQQVPQQTGLFGTSTGGSLFGTGAGTSTGTGGIFTDNKSLFGGGTSIGKSMSHSCVCNKGNDSISSTKFILQDVTGYSILCVWCRMLILLMLGIFPRLHLYV